MPSHTQSDDTTRSTCDVLFSFFGRITDSHRHHAVDTIVATDLTISQLRTLLVLQDKAEPISVNTLAESIRLSLAAAGRGVDRLVALGLVDRREDPDDRRVKRLSLTDEGQALLVDHFSMKTDDLAGLISLLPENVRIRLRDAVADALNHLSPQGKVTP